MGIQAHALQEEIRCVHLILPQNEYIGILESKIAMLEASQNWDQTGQAELMRQHCQALQNQVDEMEASIETECTDPSEVTGFYRAGVPE